jgi:hypothetical protein
MGFAGCSTDSGGSGSTEPRRQETPSTATCVREWRTRGAPSFASRRSRRRSLSSAWQWWDRKRRWSRPVATMPTSTQSLPSNPGRLPLVAPHVRQHRHGRRGPPRVRPALGRLERRHGRRLHARLVASPPRDGPNPVAWGGTRTAGVCVSGESCSTVRITSSDLWPPHGYRPAGKALGPVPSEPYSSCGFERTITTTIPWLTEGTPQQAIRGYPQPSRQRPG